MNPVLERISGFSDTEQFLNFFAIEYDPGVVHVNRLHIMRRFGQYLSRTPIPDDMDETTAMETCKGHLIQALNDFVKSTAAQEKVFKVFQEQDGNKNISLDSMKTSLSASRKKAG